LKILIESLFFQFFFNYTYNCLQTFNFTQFHPYQSQLSTPKLTVFFILVIGFKFVYLTFNWPTNFHFLQVGPWFDHLQPLH
jgi:hypothetical protein